MAYKLNPFTGELDNTGSGGGGSLTPLYTTVYLGTAPAETDGNWRFAIVGAELKVQKRVGGVWTDASVFFV